MKQIEKNVINSFRLAKSDIIQTQVEVIELGKAQQRILELLNKLNQNQLRLAQKMKDLNARKAKTKKIIVNGKRAKKTYVASKTAKKFHISNCPFAQNIKPKMKIKFASKTKALNKGLKACRCVK